MKKHNGFCCHLAQRFFERYGKLISWDEVHQLNHLSKSAPQLRYTNIKCIDFMDMKVYAYTRNGRVYSVLTEEQAFRTQDSETSRKEKELTNFAGTFSIGQLINL